MSRLQASKPSVAALLALLVAALGASAAVQFAIDGRRASYNDAPEVLWIPSGKIMKRLSLGHEGLVADIYWTRAVQYYGGQRRDGKTDFNLLGPLLDITTDLDPYLLIAYKFGAIFLSEPSPRGADDPQQAVRLIRKAIQANPDEWRLWGDLGFIYYQNLHDYPAAAAAYLEGSKNPKAAQWMKVMAAVIHEKGGNRQTSRFLWTEIFQSTEDETVRKNAIEHLQGVHASQDIEEIEKRIAQFRGNHGRPPRSFDELIADGLIGGVPTDPLGIPYRIDANGKVLLDPKSKIRLED